MYDSIKQKIKKIFYKEDPVEISMKRYLADLDYDWSGFTLTNFIQWISNSLGEPVVLIPCHLPPQICGAYVIGPESNHLILFDKDLPPILRLHTILHEAAHLLCGHQTATINHDEIGPILSNTRSFDLRLSKLTLNRHPDDKKNRQEQEAEVLALLIQSKVKLVKLKREIAAPALYDKLIFFWS